MVNPASNSMKRNALGMLFLFALTAFPAAATELKPETLKAWDSYLVTVKARLQEHLQPGACFLSIEESADRARQLRDGEILIHPVGQHTPLRVPAGMIHDWSGAAFIPNARFEDLISVNRDYAHYKDYFHPSVLSAKAMKGDGDKFGMVLMNRAAFEHNAIDGEFESHTVQVDAHKQYTITNSIRMQQIDDYGQPNEHKLAVDSGDGLIWRIFTVTRYEERDGGVYVETEAVGLSRDIPASLHWVIDPIIRRISRSSIATSLRQTRDAVCTEAAKGPSTPRALSTAFRQ